MERPPRQPHADELLQHAEFLRALARGLVNDEQAAEDVVQQTFAAALERPPRKVGRAWLGAVARRLALRHRRANARRLAREYRSARPEALPSASVLAAQLELQRAIVTAVTEMEEPYRSVLVLRYYYALDAEEIARVTGASSGTVRTRISRALDKLRARLDRGFGREAWSVVLFALVGPKKTAAGSSVASLFGGSIMTKKVSVVLCALLLVLAGGVTLLVATGGGSSRSSPRGALPARPVAAEAGAAATELAATNVSTTTVRPSIQGVVLRPDGQPAPGAGIRVYPESPGFVEAEPPPAVCDEDGRFAIPVPDVAAPWTLHAEAPGGALALMAPVFANDEVVVRLGEPALLRGRVIDLAGEPVADARVRWLGFFHGAPIVREAMSAEDGSYAVAVPAPRGAFSTGTGGGGVLVEARAEGYAPLLVESDLWHQYTPPRLELDLVLVRGARLSGRVVDAVSGVGVAGARVVLWSVEGRPRYTTGRAWVESPFVPRPLAETVADAHGTFTFDHVPANGFHRPITLWSRGVLGHVGAEAEGHARGAVALDAPEDGARVEVEILLHRAAAIEGRVVDPDGEPVAGARVWPSTRSGAPPWPDFYGATHVVETDARGRYPARVVPVPREGAAVRILATGPGASGHVDVGVHAGAAVAAPDLILAPAPVAPAILRVRVVDQAGRAVVSAYVKAEPGSASALADAEGWAELGVEPGLETVVHAYATGFPVVVSEPRRVARGEASEMLLVAQRGRRLTGRVVWADGSAVEGAQVAVYNGALPFEEAEQRSRTPRWFEARYATARTDGEGRFAAHGLPDGPYHVDAIVVSALFDARPRTRSRVDDASREVVLTLPVTEPPVPQGRIEGFVRDSGTGDDLLSFEARCGSHRVSVTAPGRFRVDHVVPGRHPLLVRAPGYAPFEGEVEQRDGEVQAVEVTLVRGGTVFGTASNATGRDLAGATVSLAADAPVWAPTSALGADGAFRLDPVAPGTYHPVVRREGGPTLAARAYDPVVVEPAPARHRLAFTIVEAGTLVVRVRFASKPSAEALARLRLRVAGEGIERTLPGSTFLRLDLAPGRYEVTLHDAGRLIGREAAPIEPGKVLELSLGPP